MLALLSTTGGLLFLVALGATGHYFWETTHEAQPERPRLLAFLSWATKGLLLPLVAWFILNSGSIPGLPPLLTPGSLNPPGTVGWVRQLPDRLAASSVLAASFWGAVTLCWLLSQVAPAVESRRDLYGVVGFWTVVALPIALILLYTGGFILTGFVTMIWSGLVLYGLLPLRNLRPSTPLYSRAIGRLKFGKTAEAEQAVLTELEKSTDDYEGWMLLAGIYAEQLHDLPLADRTIRELCTQPNVNAVQLSLACHRLADWHLRLAEDPSAARHALEIITKKLPGSHFAFMAEQRISRLPGSSEELREQNTPRTIRLPSLKDPLDDAPTSAPTAPQPGGMERALQLVARLELRPGDYAVREELARVLAEQVGNFTQAIEQLELLLSDPSTPTDRHPEWLAQLAAWNLVGHHNPVSARGHLERLVREFPASPQAFTAQRRLNLLDFEASLNGREKPSLKP